jgi:chaperonin GroES
VPLVRTDAADVRQSGEPTEGDAMTWRVDEDRAVTDVRLYEALRKQTNVNRILPMNDNVIVRLVQSDVRTPGGMYLPQPVGATMVTGEVIATGPGILDEHGERIPTGVTEGDMVVFAKHMATELWLKETLFAIRADGIVGVLKDQPSVPAEQTPKPKRPTFADFDDSYDTARKSMGAGRDNY